jgi:hypothetical protein
MRTFQDVFPHASLWRGPKYPGFYLIGAQQPLRLPVDRFARMFNNPKLRHDINEWDNLVPSGQVMLNLLLLDESEMAEYLRGVPIISDNHPYTEFPLWRWIFNPAARKKRCTANVVLKWKKEKKRPSR